MKRAIFLWGSSAFIGVSFGAKYSDKVQFAQQKVISYSKQCYDEHFGGTDASETTSHTLTSKQVLQNAVSKTRDSGEFAVLSTTSSSDGFVSSRLIQPFPVEFDPVSGKPVIYFNTNKLSRKVEDMTKSPQVTLTYVSEKHMSYVAWRGPVRRISYPESTKHWNDSLYMFYPEGNNEAKGSRFTTWVLEPNNVQMVAVVDNMASERDDWRPPEIALDGSSTGWVLVCDGKDKAK